MDSQPSASQLSQFSQFSQFDNDIPPTQILAEPSQPSQLSFDYASASEGVWGRLLIFTHGTVFATHELVKESYIIARLGKNIAFDVADASEGYYRIQRKLIEGETYVTLSNHGKCKMLVENQVLEQHQEVMLFGGEMARLTTNSKNRFSMQFVPARKAPRLQRADSLKYDDTNGAELGIGAFSKVRVCIDKRRGTKFAAKIVQLGELQTNVSNTQIDDSLREVQILQLVREKPHANVIEMVDHCQRDSTLYIYLE
jgi:hypothetical protein